MSLSPEAEEEAAVEAAVEAAEAAEEEAAEVEVEGEGEQQLYHHFPLNHYQLLLLQLLQ